MVIENYSESTLSVEPWARVVVYYLSMFPEGLV
jgi:hypothetical protein